MSDSTENPPHETLLHDALHAHVREGGDSVAVPHLVGLADGALRVARRRQRLARAGVGITAGAVVATGWVAFADGATQHGQVDRPAAAGTGDTEKPALISILPVTSSTEHACTHGSGGYTVYASEAHPTLCIHADLARGMTDVRVTSAKAVKSRIDGTWQVEVTLSSADRARFAALTGSIAAAPSPRNDSPSSSTASCGATRP
ncbi:hypothetical protein [Streptomyces sp. NPDC005244]|uniref:hypothetical protein n=1 Tax=Streptomyces sp. NPDC005244 TaxID=3364708 RepID=UPI0036BD24B5